MMKPVAAPKSSPKQNFLENSDCLQEEFFEKSMTEAIDFFSKFDPSKVKNEEGGISLTDSKVLEAMEKGIEQ